MKLLLLFAFTNLFLVFGQNAEFYQLDPDANGLNGRRADPCVNIQKLSGSRPDCTPNSQQPAASNTYYLPYVDAAATVEAKKKLADTSLTITGKFLAAGSLALAPLTSPDSCATVDPNMFVTTASLVTTAPTGTTLSFNPYKDWISWTGASGLVEQYPRALCYKAIGSPGWQWTGFHMAVVYSCDLSTNLCSLKPTFPTLSFVDPAVRAIYDSQTTCCPVGNVQPTFRVGQCRNTNFQTCCGSVPITSQMKCCNETVETISWADGTCPCYAMLNTSKQLVAQCPNGEACCLPTKYTELNTPATKTAPILPADTNKVGDCYNPQTHRCCNTGFKYDPGSEQCCAVNGIQSLNFPCPCSTDAHCKGGQTYNGDVSQAFQLQDMKCCFQTAPPTFEQFLGGYQCDSYANYPAGTGHFSVQQCYGQCIDMKYQVCCNGRACIRQYERCCNSTCCNRFTGTCQTGTTRQGSSRNNFWEVGQSYDICTNVEQIDLMRAWWMFVLPSFLLMGTLLCLAISLVFAGRVESSARRALEKGMIVAALISIMFATCTFFAPIYKYGVVIVFTGLFGIITAAARRRGMYIANIVFQVLLIIYLIDPFHGNDYFNLAVDRNSFGRTDPYAAGLWHATSRIWDVPQSCWDFYIGYFRFDPLIRDHMRYEEANNPSFGYCSRGWVSALLVFDGFIIISVIVQFLLAVVALLLRTQKTVA